MVKIRFLSWRSVAPASSRDRATPQHVLFFVGPSRHTIIWDAMPPRLSISHSCPIGILWGGHDPILLLSFDLRDKFEIGSVEDGRLLGRKKGSLCIPFLQNIKLDTFFSHGQKCSCCEFSGPELWASLELHLVLDLVGWILVVMLWGKKMNKRRRKRKNLSSECVKSWTSAIPQLKIQLCHTLPLFPPWMNWSSHNNESRFFLHFSPSHFLLFHRPYYYYYYYYIYSVLGDLTWLEKRAE